MAKAKGATARIGTEGVAAGMLARPRLRLIWDRGSENGAPPEILERGAPSYLVAFHRGMMCANAGQDEMALAAFREAAQAKPDFDLAHYNIGVALEKLGDRHMAMIAYARATEIDPDFAEAFYNWGMACAEVGMRRDAQNCLRKAFTLRPSPDYACGLAWSFARLGRQIPEAIAAYRMALFLEPDYPEDRAEIEARIEKLEALGKSKKGNYNPDGDMTTRRDLNALADALGYTSFEQAKIALERGAPKTARDDNTAREQTAAPAPAAPPSTEALQWPTEKWKGSPEELSRKQHAIVAFLRRVWKPFIDGNNLLVTRAMLAEHDEEAAGAIKNYVRTNSLPSDIRIVRGRDVRKVAARRPLLTVGNAA